MILIYVDDIHNIACHYTNDIIKQYTDDTFIIVKARNTTELKFETNVLLSHIKQWSFANKLSINTDKTKALIISQKLNETDKYITLSITNFLIQIVNSFKYLGVILYNKLSFKNHTANLENRIARSVGVTSKLKHYVPSKILMKLYHILIHPHLLCGILVWESTFKTYVRKIISLQNKTLGLITNSFDFKLRSTSSYT